MKDTLASKLVSFQASLTVADKEENKPLWQNKPPIAFGEALLAARTAVAALATAAADQSANIRGVADALRGMRIQFENALHPLTRATFRCLKNLGNNQDASKVDFTPTDLRIARAVALSGIGETVLNLAEPLTRPGNNGQPAPGDKYGVTAVKFAELDELWTNYSTAVGAPASARARRKAITDALPGQFARVEEQFAELDDLVIQFRGTEVGDRFVEAWFNARRVVDTGRRAARPNPTTTPPPAIAA